MDGVAGVTAIVCSTAAFTVSVVFPDTDPNVADMTEVPTVTPVARPPLLMVATAGVPELHVTDVVISLLVPSE